jgi:hypothetical protein
VELDKRAAMWLLYGFALGIAVGIVLESSGALSGLDRAIGRRFMAAAPPGAPEEAVRGAEERPPAA